MRTIDLYIPDPRRDEYHLQIGTAPAVALTRKELEALETCVRTTLHLDDTENQVRRAEGRIQ